ncbi:MAG: hypothetical protein EOM19_04755 [Candidatus Moranbacteria bacterium]|nr:hypothetical protein [Candidatus Moranbacteria bacterium]
MKQLSKQFLILIILVAVTVLAIGFFVLQNKTKPLVSEVEEEHLQINDDQENSKTPGVDLLTLLEAGIDTSEWKTYRNEEYGFEFELPKEYFLPENEKNVIREENGISILDPSKDEYIFNSRKGLEMVKETRENAGGGDVSDYWMVKVGIHTYSDTFATDFKQWIFDTYDADDTNVQDVGSVKVSNAEISYFCWVSILGDDCGAYFTDKQSVVEVKAWNLVSDDEKINFNYEILQTVRY